ncbi:hypothetical protein JW935_16245 [candidate division KSB1 bacterium]|nr:hypothetical protein [candidate division KSB1 bacterium]
MRNRNSNNNGGRRGRISGFRQGPGGTCICPQCGTTVPHTQGQPCSQLVCPNCSAAMTRQR